MSRETVALEDAVLTTDRAIAVGHELACGVAAGERIREYDGPMGTGTCAIGGGTCAHTHNAASNPLPTCTLPA